MVYRRSSGAGWGEFAKGFSEAFAAMMKLSEDKRYHEAIEAHWLRQDQMAGRNDPFLNGTVAGARTGYREGVGGSSYGDGSGSYNAPTGDASQRAQEYSKYLQDQGYTKAGAAAILGNWWQENSLNGGGFGGDKGTSAGGFQWHDMPGSMRGTGFVNWANANNLNVHDPMTSLKYVAHDLNTNPQWGKLNSELKSTDDVDAATHSFTRIYEAPDPKKANMPNRVGFARAVYGKGPDKTEPTTADGKPAVTTIVEGKPSATPTPKVEKAANKSAQADRPPDDQVASISDDEAMAVAIRKNQELKEQQDRDNPAPPPGPDAPMPKRSLPLDQQTQPRPPPPNPNERASAIPPGPRVAAQDTPHHQWQQDEQPPLPPVQGREVGPENAGPRQWQEADQPPLPPVQGREVGPENAGYRQWNEANQPALPPVPGEGPIDPSIIARQRIKAQQDARRPAQPPSTGPMPHDPETPSSVRPQFGPEQRTGAPPNVGTTPSAVPDPEKTSPGRTGPAEVNVPLAGGARDERTTPDADKPAAGAIPTSATAPTPQSRNGPRFIGITRPNASPQNSAQGTQGQMQSTALDFSSLWGPNPPVSQRGQAAATPVAVAAPRRDDDNAPIPTPDLTGLTDEQVMGQAKGGAVRRYAMGGAIPARPAMRYAGGGATAYMSPTYIGPNLDGSWRGSTTYDQLAPNQQAWADSTKSILANELNAAHANYMYWSGGGRNPTGNTPNPYWDQLTTMPDAVWPTAAPAAPATVNQPAPTVDATVKPVADTITVDPTTTSGTGTPKVPNIIKAKTYDPNVDPMTGAKFTNTSNTGGTNYTVNPDGTMQTNDAGDTISGYAGGGAIPTQPTMRFAGGGAAAYGGASPTPIYPTPLTYATWQSPTSTTYVPPASQVMMGAHTRDLAVPNMDPSYAGFQPYSRVEAAKANDPSLTPDQKAWYQQQTANAVSQNWSYYYNPASYPTTPAPAAAATPAPAAAAPTPVAPTTTTVNAPTPGVDPNNQPGAGTPGLNDNLAPTTTDTTTPPVVTPPAPIVDPTIDTVVNTPTNPVPKQAKTYDPTQDTSGKYASGGRDQGGNNYQRTIDPNSATSFGAYDYGQIQGFDDGGGVNPSAYGMPPGLSSGQQPTPPIYYSGATYAPAGAPVGRGITQNSLPTQIGMAIPTLPMLRGGMVRRYADGGGVEDDVDVSTGMPNIDIEQGGRSGSNAYSGEYGGAAPSAPDPYATASSPQQAHPDLPAWTPQVNDGQGNPSRGLVGAIAGGLHYLASQLGLDGSGQQGAVAGDPQTQANRRSFVQGDGVPGAPMPTHEEVSQIHQSLGLNDGLHEGLANLAGMEAARNFYNLHGDPVKADQMAASMLQYSVTLSRDYGDQAVKRYYANDLNGAVHAMMKAKEAIADGTLMNAHVNEDGQSVNIEGTDLSGKRLWAKTVGPEAILGAALHTADGSLAWHMYEMQAAKYDQPTADMIKARRDRAQQEDASGIISGMGPQYGAPVEGSAPSAPQIEPVNAPPAPRPAQPQGGPPLAPGQTMAGAIPQVAGLQSVPALTRSALDASRQPLPETASVMENRGRSPDTTSASNASPPATADNNQPPVETTGVRQDEPAPPAIPPNALAARAAIGPAQAPPTLGVGPTREAAASLPSADAQEVAALSPEAEQTRLREITAQTRPTYFTADNRPIVGGIPMNRPPVMDAVTFKKYAPQVQKYYQDWWTQFNQASQENNRQMQQDINAAKGDFTATLNVQRQGAQMRQQQALEDRREASRQTAATTADTRKYEHERSMEVIKAQLQEHNTAFTANSAGSAPRKLDDVKNEATGQPYDSYIEVAKAFNPALVDAKSLDRTQAMNDLQQKGFTANTMKVLAGAWENAVRHSPNTTPDEISSGIQAFVNANHFIAHAEATDAQGRPIPVHGVVRYDVTVEDNAGIPITFRIPADDLMRLRGLQQQYVRARTDTLAKQVSTRDLASLVDNPNETGMAPTSLQDWQARTPEQQTQEPPF